MSEPKLDPDWSWQDLNVESKYAQLGAAVSGINRLAEAIIFKCWKILPKNVGWRLKVQTSVRSYYVCPVGKVEHLDPRLVKGTGSTFLGLLKVFIERAVRLSRLPLRLNITPEKMEIFPTDYLGSETKVVKISLNEHHEVGISLEEESEARSRP